MPLPPEVGVSSLSERRLQAAAARCSQDMLRSEIWKNLLKFSHKRSLSMDIHPIT
jgi:hypothetical protein